MKTRDARQLVGNKAPALSYGQTQWRSQTKEGGAAPRILLPDKRTSGHPTTQTRGHRKATHWPRLHFN